jgi:hypothetical protein
MVSLWLGHSSTGTLEVKFMKNFFSGLKLFVRGFLTITVLTPSLTLAQTCIELAGVYPNCEILPTISERVTVVITQKVQAGAVTYEFDFAHENKPYSFTMVADGISHPVQIRGSTEPLPKDLTYKTICDMASVISIVKSPTLAGTSSERLTFTRRADGTLQLLDQTLVLGRVTSESLYSCRPK